LLLRASSGRREEFAARCGRADRQRQPVEPDADFGNGGAVAVRQGKPDRTAEAHSTKANGGVVLQHADVIPLLSQRQVKRARGNSRSARTYSGVRLVVAFSAPAGLQQIGDQRCSRDNLLTTCRDQQQLLL
jgi:hypothetical protein